MQRGRSQPAGVGSTQAEGTACRGKVTRAAVTVQKRKGLAWPGPLATLKSGSLTGSDGDEVRMRCMAHTCTDRAPTEFQAGYKRPRQ